MRSAACFTHSHGCFTGSLNSKCLKLDCSPLVSLSQEVSPSSIGLYGQRALCLLRFSFLQLSRVLHHQVVSTLSRKYWWNLSNSFAFTDILGKLSLSLTWKNPNSFLMISPPLSPVSHSFHIADRIMIKTQTQSHCFLFKPFMSSMSSHCS